MKFQSLINSYLRYRYDKRNKVMKYLCTKYSLLSENYGDNYINYILDDVQKTFVPNDKFMEMPDMARMYYLFKVIENTCHDKYELYQKCYADDVEVNISDDEFKYACEFQPKKVVDITRLIEGENNGI